MEDSKEYNFYPYIYKVLRRMQPQLRTTISPEGLEAINGILFKSLDKFVDLYNQCKDVVHCYITSIVENNLEGELMEKTHIKYQDALKKFIEYTKKSRGLNGDSDLTREE